MPIRLMKLGAICCIEKSSGVCADGCNFGRMPESRDHTYQLAAISAIGYVKLTIWRKIVALYAWKVSFHGREDFIVP